MHEGMANYRPRFVGRPTVTSIKTENGSKGTFPQGQSTARPEKYDVVSGPAPMKTTNAFHASGPTASTPKIGLGLGF